MADPTRSTVARTGYSWIFGSRVDPHPIQRPGAGSPDGSPTTRRSQEGSKRPRGGGVAKIQGMLGALLLCLTGSQALAQPATGTAAEARALFDEGVAALAEQAWDRAEELFRHSEQRVPRTSTRYNLALSLFRLGRPLEALQTLVRLERDADPEADARYLQYAQQLRSHLRPQLARITLQIQPAHAEVTVDGQSHAGSGPARVLFLLPGSHDFGVRADGFTAAHFELEVQAGSDLLRAVELGPAQLSPKPEAEPPLEPAPGPRAQPPAPQEPSTPAQAPVDGVSGLSTPSLILLGSAALLVGASAVTAVVASDKDEEFERACPTLRDCDPALKPLQADVRRYSLATDLLWVAGALSAAAGLGLYLWHDYGSGAKAELSPSAQGVTLHGIF